MTLKSDVTIDISGFNLGVYIVLYEHPQKSIVLAFSQLVRLGQVLHLLFTYCLVLCNCGKHLGFPVFHSMIQGKGGRRRLEM